MDYAKLYRYGEKLKPGYGEDLVHHSIILAAGRELKHPETYLYRVMLSEVRRPHSKFNKEFFPKEAEVKPETSLRQINDDLLKSAMDEFEREHPTEMNVFKMCIESGIVPAAKKIGVHWLTLEKIFIFAKTEIKKKYDIRDNSDDLYFDFTL